MDIYNYNSIRILPTDVLTSMPFVGLCLPCPFGGGGRTLCSERWFHSACSGSERRCGEDGRARLASVSFSILVSAAVSVLVSTEPEAASESPPCSASSHFTSPDQNLFPSRSFFSMVTFRQRPLPSGSSTSGDSTSIVPRVEWMVTGPSNAGWPRTERWSARFEESNLVGRERQMGGGGGDATGGADLGRDAKYGFGDLQSTPRAKLTVHIANEADHVET